MLVSLYICFRLCFRHIQTYSSVFQEHTHGYTEPWDIPITKYIGTQWYIHNTRLKTLTKAPSRTFELNAPLNTF